MSVRVGRVLCHLFAKKLEMESEFSRCEVGEGKEGEVRLQWKSVFNHCEVGKRKEVEMRLGGRVFIVVTRRVYIYIEAKKGR